MPQSNKNPTHSTPNNLPLIRASELAQYSFCHRAWWLGSVKKLQSENQASLTRGRNVHTQHERRVKGASRWRQAGFLFISAGSLFFIIMLFLLWLGSG